MRNVYSKPKQAAINRFNSKVIIYSYEELKQLLASDEDIFGTFRGSLKDGQYRRCFYYICKLCVKDAGFSNYRGGLLDDFNETNYRDIIEQLPPHAFLQNFVKPQHLTKYHKGCYDRKKEKNDYFIRVFFQWIPRKDNCKNDTNQPPVLRKRSRKQRNNNSGALFQNLIENKTLNLRSKKTLVASPDFTFAEAQDNNNVQNPEPESQSARTSQTLSEEVPLMIQFADDNNENQIENQIDNQIENQIESHHFLNHQIIENQIKKHILRNLTLDTLLHFKSQICQNMDQGSCLNGWSCHYAHSNQELLPKMRIFVYADGDVDNITPTQLEYMRNLNEILCCVHEQF